MAASKQQFAAAKTVKLAATVNNGKVGNNFTAAKTVKLAAILLQRKTVQLTAILPITVIMDTNYEAFFCILRLLWGNAACDPNLVSALGAYGVSELIKRN